MRQFVRHVSSLVLLVFAVICNIAAADEPAAAPVPMTAVLLAPSRPVFIQLSAMVDGKDSTGFRERFVSQWFAELDQNNGALEESELAGLAANAAPPVDSASAFDWKTFDTTPTDTRLTPAEFRSLADNVLGAPFETVEAVQTADEAAGLFSLLDADHDGALTTSEISKARQMLVPFDADDDETISAAELNAAAKAAQGANRPEQAASKLLLVVDSKHTAESIAEQVLHRYDVGTVAGDKQLSPDGLVDHAELGLEAEMISPFDKDGSGNLNVAELARLIVELPPRVGVTVDLFDAQRGQAAVSVLSLLPGLPIDVKSLSNESASLQFEGFQVGYRAERTRSSNVDSRRYYSLRLRLVDKDKNNYLDAKEFTALGLPAATFEEVDADKNSQVVEQEVVAFLSKVKAVRINQIVMRITDESRPLFKMLDVREDSRLSPRELNTVADQLKNVDANKNGKITRAEITTQIAVDFSVKRPAAARDPNMAMMAQPARAVVVPREEGPDWFLRMDRNYDGDVSWREFLGPRKVFDRLDADHDGLLSPAEAEHTE